MTDPRPPFRERFEQANSEEITPRRQELRRLAAALREVIDEMVATDAPLDVLSQLADHAEAFMSELRPHARGRRYEGWSEAAMSGDPHAFFEHSPLIGTANPLSPPIELTIDGDEVVGRCRFGLAYEGPPGHVHGGFVAASFDEVLGFANAMTGQGGMTGRLIVHYRKPTPLLTDLRFAARVVRIEGRKIFVTAELYAGDELTAEAEGLFVTVDFEKMLNMRAARDGD